MIGDPVKQSAKLIGDPIKQSAKLVDIRPSNRPNSSETRSSNRSNCSETRSSNRQNGAATRLPASGHLPIHCSRGSRADTPAAVQYPTLVVSRVPAHLLDGWGILDVRLAHVFPDGRHHDRQQKACGKEPGTAHQPAPGAVGTARDTASGFAEDPEHLVLGEISRGARLRSARSAFCWDG